MPPQNRGTAWEEIGEWLNIRGPLTPEERARITELQDALIERFVEHRDALADGQETRATELQAEIDSLLHEEEEIEKWATAGSA